MIAGSAQTYSRFQLQTLRMGSGNETEVHPSKVPGVAQNYYYTGWKSILHDSSEQEDMEEDDIPQGGYDLRFDDPPDDLVCLVCHMVVREARQVECCGKVFCEYCIGEVNSRLGHCPNLSKTVTKNLYRSS